MTRKIQLLAVSVLTAALSGCVGLPSYTAGQGTALSPVRLSPNMTGNTLGLVTAEGSYSLPSKDGFVYVPDGARVRIWRRYDQMGVTTAHFSTSSYCAPNISFIPQVGMAYYLDFELRGDHCSLLIYRKDPTSRVGIALEPTIER